MKRSILVVLAAGLALTLASAVQAQPYPGERYRSEPRGGGGRFAGFDVRDARSWGERLALCDTTAFLASRPDLNASRIWVRRDDGRRDLLLPPDFVGAGLWYKEGYRRLFWQLQRERQVSSAEVYRAQNGLSRRFVEAYRSINGHYGAGVDSRFLDAQDRYCRMMARSEGVIVS
jgi:hypothetical protein